MENEVSQTIKLAVEIIIVGILLFIISFFSYYSYAIYNKTNEDESSKQLVTESNTLYYYNDKDVNSSDVIDCIIGNARTYEFIISYNGEVCTLSHEDEGSQGVFYWTKDNIIKNINSSLGIDWNSNLSSKFYAELLWCKNGDTVIGTKSDLGINPIGNRCTGYSIAGVKFTLE